MQKISIILFLMVFTAGLSGCKNLIFHPSSYMFSTPSDFGLQYENIELISSDGTKLHAWWLPAQGITKGTVYFLHGNAQNISVHINNVAWLPKQGYQVLLLDYRGFGRSKGTASIPEVFADIKAGMDWLAKNPHVNGKPLYLLGQSLGAVLGGFVVGNSAQYLANFDAIVLDAGFTGFRAMSKEVTTGNWLTWPFQYPIKWLMPTGYELIDVVANISPTPLLIIHGRQDRVIPFHHGEQLYEKANRPKVFIEYQGGHIESFRSVKVRQYLLQFFTDSKAI